MPDNDLRVTVTTDCDVDYLKLPKRLHEYYDVNTALAGYAGFTLQFVYKYKNLFGPGIRSYHDKAGYFATAEAALAARKEAKEMIQAARKLKGL